MDTKLDMLHDLKWKTEEAMCYHITCIMPAERRTKGKTESPFGG